MKRYYYGEIFFQSTRTEQNSSTKVLRNISRDWHKSAPYPRPKNSKGRQSVKYSFAVPESVNYSFTVQKLGRIGALKGGAFQIFQHPLLSIVKKMKRGPLGFLTSMLWQNIQKT